MYNRFADWINEWVDGWQFWVLQNNVKKDKTLTEFVNFISLRKMTNEKSDQIFFV